MATLEHVDSGEPWVPATRAVVGRAPTCSRVLWDAGVSGEHALVHWNGTRWAVRDLGSRNGTWVDGTRLDPGQDAELGPGTELRFAVDAQVWVVLDVEPPGAAETPTPALPATRDITRRARIDDVALRIRASADEEYVAVDLITRGHPEQLESRTWHDLYLVLARARLADRDGRSEADEGWVYVDDLCRMLGRSRERVNVEVYRARHQLAELGIDEAVRVFERRAPTRQIRLGVADVTVGPL